MAGAIIAATGTGWPRRCAHDHHVIAPDLRGHGESAWSASGHYTMASYIYDLAQLIHQQGLAPVDIVAHSLGGNIALRYAGIYPETVRRLVAIEGLGPGPRRHADAARKPIAERMRGWIDQQRASPAASRTAMPRSRTRWRGCRRRTST